MSADEAVTGRPRSEPAIDGESELKAQLAQFTLTFLKGIMMTGIYPPDHPAIADVTSEPFLRLKKLAPSTNEITYMSASAAVGDEILVEGVLSEGIPFKTLMHTSMGEIFAKKFLAYFERNHLVSFSIKPRVSESEFQRFVSLFAERRVQEEQAGRALAIPFGDMLIKKGILHVTAMAREEMVGGERPLPWRVKLAISRLRKDLTIVPLYSEATAQELAEAKTLLVQDITRPLRHPQFLKELLANTDLISKGVKELSTVDIDREIIYCLQDTMLESISWEIVGDLERASWGAIRQKIGSIERRLDEVFKTLLKKIALRLKDSAPAAVKNLLNHLFKKKIITYSDLPRELQQELLSEKWTDQFLANRDMILERFRNLAEPKAYYDYLGTLDYVFPELLRRGKVAECALLASVIRDHAANPSAAIPDRQERARCALSRMTEPTVMQTLIQAVNTKDKEARRGALDCLACLGDRSLPHLLRLLETCEMAQVRRDVAKTIEGIGVEAYVPLIEKLGQRALPWYVFRNVIMLLGNLGCKAATEDIRKFLSHPHPRVREESMVALQKLEGEHVVADVIQHLKDKDSTVARRAIVILGTLGCQTPLFLKALLDLLAKPKEKEADRPEELILAALDAVTRLGPFDLDGVSVLDLLLERLEAERPLLGRLLGKVRPESGDKLRAALCAAVGAIGDEGAVKVLQGLAKDQSLVVKQRAAEAVRQIKERLSR